MATSARNLLAERAERDVAKAQLDAQVAKLKADYEDRGIGGRIADELSVKASAALDEVSDVAGQSKGIIGGTIGLLALWFLRKPILSALEAALGSETEDEGLNSDDHE